MKNFLSNINAAAVTSAAAAKLDESTIQKDLLRENNHIVYRTMSMLKPKTSMSIVTPSMATTSQPNGKG